MKLRSAGLAAARVLAPLFGFPAARLFLSHAVRFLEALQGIGSGANFGPRELSDVFRFLPQDTAVVFDVGAHAGRFLEQALRRTPPDCVVHAFEPSRTSFRQLAASFESNKRVRLNRCALSSAAGSGVLFFGQPGSELASLTPRPRFALTQSEGVRLDTLDGYCQANQIPRIDLLKLDVEGHELEVLEGARGLLSQAAVGRIIFEFGGCNIDTRTFFRDFDELLTGFGMKISRLTPGGLIPIANYDESLERFRTTNYLATLVAPDVYSS